MKSMLITNDGIINGQIIEQVTLNDMTQKFYLKIIQKIFNEGKVS